MFLIIVTDVNVNFVLACYLINCMFVSVPYYEIIFTCMILPIKQQNRLFLIIITYANVHFVLALQYIYFILQNETLNI